MAGLSIKLLGPLLVTLDGRAADGFESNKVRALLVYLAMERQKPHARESLAGLLWPEFTQRSALNNLRSALANMRLAIGDREAEPPYLLISRDTLQFNLESDCSLDTMGLEMLDEETPQQWEQAADAYRGPFLEGFSLADSPPFEEWLLYKREQFNRQLLDARQRLGAYYEANGDFRLAIEQARRALEMEPWLEGAQRLLMRALALSGQRSAALVQYESCRRVLEDELGIAPAEETTALAESIRVGTLQALDGVPAGDFGAYASQPPAPGKPPFKGLSYFEEADTGRFFGRERLTAQLAQLVQQTLAPGWQGWRLLSVIGASGSGKSSAARAGLVPALKGDPDGAAALDHGGETAVFAGDIRVFTPTAHPLEALAISLTNPQGTVAETASLMDSLAEDPRSLHLAAARLADKHNGQPWLLLVVDQFEELFTLCHDEVERQAFIENLLTAAEMTGPVAVVVVLRADFYVQCAPYAGLRQALCRNQQYIGAMDAQELRRAIAEPARRENWAFEPGLVERFLSDAGDEPGALPLLSHALLATWRRRQGRTLTHAGYEESGGVQGAITQTAETVYQELTPAQQAIARLIFLRLTEVGESSGDETAPVFFTRRRASLAELVPHEQEAAEVQKVLVKLADARLITTAHETAEVAHEALIQEWERLRRWLDESREALRMQRQLTAAAQEWERLQRDNSALYRGARLAQAAEWAVAHPGEISSQEQAFVQASLAEEQAQEAAEAERQRRELEAAQVLAEEQRQRAEEQSQAASKLRRRAVWLALAAGGLMILLLAAVGLGQLASRNAAAAEEQTKLAISRELAAAAGNNLLLDPERSVLLALQALETADTVEARNALHQALPELHVLRTIPFTTGGVPGVSFSPDGSRIAGMGVTGEVRVWDAATGETVLTIPGPAVTIGFDLTYSPDGTRIATVTDLGVEVRDASSGDLLLTLPGASDGTVRRLDFSSDGRRLAVGNQDGLPRVWDLATQEELLAFSGHETICEAVAFSPDSKLLATGDITGIVKIWDAATGEELLSFDHGGGIHGVAYSPDGQQLAVASDNARLGIYDTATGEALTNMPVRSGVYDVDYMADGQRLAAAHQDGTTTIWDPSSGQQMLLLPGHTSTVISTAPSPDSSILATGGYDGTVKLWDVNPGHELLTIAAHEEPVYDVAYTPEGAQLATVGFDGRAKLWDASTGLLVRSLPPDEADTPLASLAFSPDGQQVVMGGWDGSLFLAGMDEMVAERLPAYEGVIMDLAFSPDGERLATASWAYRADVWDVASGESIAEFLGQDENGVPMGFSGIAFSTDGKSVFVGGDNDYIHRWDIATGEERQSFYSDGLDVYGVDASANGKYVAMGRQDGVVSIWDIATGEKVHQLPAHAGLVLRVVFSRDSSKLASVGFDSLSKVWDVETGQQIATLYGVTGNVFGGDFSPDGQHFAAAGGDGTVRMYTLDLEELIGLSRERVTRGLTDEECRVYLHVEPCPE